MIVTPHFRKFNQSYGLWFTPRFRFRSISWEQIDTFVTKFCICLDIDKFESGIVKRHSSLIFTGVLVLNLRKNVPAQYLKNQLTDFHHIVYMHRYWQDLGWDCYIDCRYFALICARVMVVHLQQNFFSAQYLNKQMYIFSSNFVNALLLTRFEYGLLNVSELCPLI